MQRIKSSPVFTDEFHSAFDTEVSSLMRRRFLWFSGAMTLLGLISIVVLVARNMAPLPGTTVGPAEFAIGICWTSIYAIAFAIIIRTRPRGETLLTFTIWLVMLDGVLNILQGAASIGVAPGLAGFMFSHIAASALLPWSPRQALKPAAAVIGFNALVMLTSGETSLFAGNITIDYIFGLCFTPLIALPGWLIARLRHSQRIAKFRTRFLHDRYAEVRRDLVDARRLHESLFTPPILTGPVRTSYNYEPMRQIGGDFFYASQMPDPDGKPRGLNAVLLDVTGHGIAAALTVNRIHGEIQRIFAETPDAGPGEILDALNRYAWFTLAQHGVFLTALCVRVLPGRDTLEYASGGHPPAILRARDGAIQRLESTAYMLGVCADHDFDPAPQTLPFLPGDAALLYTDGATEARGQDGRLLGTEGFLRLLTEATEAPPGQWAVQASTHINTFRAGPPQDDTLMVEVYRPIEVEHDHPTRAHSATTKI